MSILLLFWPTAIKSAKNPIFSPIIIISRYSEDSLFDFIYKIYLKILNDLYQRLKFKNN